MLWFALQLAISAAILFSFNYFAIWIGLASLSLVALYPLAKRVTFWPQFVLGLAFNWGALLGWAAVTADVNWPAFVLYAGGIFWTLGYDTIYAHQDRPDDTAAGVKSSARALGLMASKPWLVAFYLIAAALFGIAGFMHGYGFRGFRRRDSTAGIAGRRRRPRFTQRLPRQVQIEPIVRMASTGRNCRRASKLATHGHSSDSAKSASSSSENASISAVTLLTAFSSITR